jgi:hypothetical protein
MAGRDGGAVTGCRTRRANDVRSDRRDASAAKAQAESGTGTAPETGQSLQDSPMTTLAKLLARKRQLLERLQEDPGQHERDEIERQLEEIDTALNLLDEAGPGKSSDEQ